MKFIILNAVFKIYVTLIKKDDRHLNENLAFHTLNGGTYVKILYKYFLPFKNKI